MKKKAPPANSATAFTTDPSQQRFTAQKHAVIKELIAVVLQYVLSVEHAKTLLGRIIQLLEWGKQAVHKLPEANA